MQAKVLVLKPKLNRETLRNLTHARKGESGRNFAVTDLPPLCPPTGLMIRKAG